MTLRDAIREAYAAMGHDKEADPSTGKGEPVLTEREQVARRPVRPLHESKTRSDLQRYAAPPSGRRYRRCLR